MNPQEILGRGRGLQASGGRTGSLGREENSEVRLSCSAEAFRFGSSLVSVRVISGLLVLLVMSSSDRVVLVLGGAGTVGSGIVKALLDKGCKVAVISRDVSRLQRLRSFICPSTEDNLVTLVGNVGSEDGAEQVKRALLQKLDKVTDVVSSLGFSWWQGGPPHTQTLQDLHWVMESLLFCTFVSWKTFFPLVRDEAGSSYTFITGGAGEKLLMPGTGFLTVGAAGALAFCQVVREEYPQVPCRLHQVKIDTGVATPERSTPGFVNHLDLGVAVANLVEKGSPAHGVFTVGGPADLQFLGGNL